MLIIAFLIMFFLTVVGFYVSRDLFAPHVIVPGIWVALGIIAVVLHPHYYSLDARFIFPVIIWTVTFCVACYWTALKTKPSTTEAINTQPNRQIIKAYIWISALLMPVVIGVSIWLAFVNDPANFFRYLRIMNTGIDENIDAPNIGPLQYIPAVAYISLLMALVYIKKKSVIILLLIINLLGALITMAKTIFLCVFFATLFILYKKKKMTIKSIVIGFLCFILFSLVLQSFRIGSEESATETVETNDFFSMYLLSSPVAFNYHAEPASAVRFGDHTFRMWYAIENSLGLTKKPPVDVILDFVSVPDYTNTYTIMYPFYIDFGLIGLIFFSIIYGIMFGYLYKKTATGGTVALIIYAAFVNFLLLEGIGEFVFTNLSQTLQYFILALIPFIFRKPLVLWRKQK